jgi:hypothetical protein
MASLGCSLSPFPDAPDVPLLADPDANASYLQPSAGTATAPSLLSSQTVLSPRADAGSHKQPQSSAAANRDTHVPVADDATTPAASARSQRCSLLVSAITVVLSIPALIGA